MYPNCSSLLLNAKGTEAATWSLSAIPSRFSEMVKNTLEKVDETDRFSFSSILNFRVCLMSLIRWRTRTASR